MRLLITVFLTPNSLTKYRTGALYKRNGRDVEKIDRFLTMLKSLSIAEWSVVDLYISVDSPWERHKSKILDFADEIFPGSYRGERLEFVEDWRLATQSIADDELVLLQSNDDHLLLPDRGNELDKLAKQMNSENLKIAAITHYPEYRGLANRQRKEYSKGRSDTSSVYVIDAIGTTLVHGSFLKSWFSQESFKENIRIVRPDNPFGQSVTFPKTLLGIPVLEIMRHLDGYSHAGLYRPLPPVRSNFKFDPEHDLIIKQEPFISGLWPSRLFGYRGTGVDFYQTNSKPGDNFIYSLRLDVAKLIAFNSLRIDWKESLKILSPAWRANIVYRTLLGLILMFNWNSWINYVDIVLESIFFGTKKRRLLLESSDMRIMKLIVNLGLVRASRVYLKGKYWWLLPSNFLLVTKIVTNKARNLLH